MVIKGSNDNLSRKELQSSKCKVHGVPANKSHSQLEHSLVSLLLEERMDGSMGNLPKASHSKCKGSGGVYHNRKPQRNSSAERCVSFSKETQHRDTDHARCVKTSPFQFFVRSDDGLNLYVDLNSSSSDWIQTFKREIHIYENVEQNKSWTLHDDLECVKDGEKGLASFSSPCSSELHKELVDRSEKGEMSLGPLPVHVDVSDTSKENQVPSHPDSDVNVDANANPSGSQNDDSSFPNPGCSVSSCVQTSEVASCNKDVSGLNGEFHSTTKEDNKEGGCELNHLPVSAEQGEWSNILDERESSECSKLCEKTVLKSENLDRNNGGGGGHQKRRKLVEAELRGNGEANVKILRSMKRKKDLPRRSMRLMSK